MSLSALESGRKYIPKFSTRFFAKSPSEDVIEYFVDSGREQQNARHAERIATLVWNTIGNRTPGSTQWAEKSIEYQDRIFDLFAADWSMEIHTSSTLTCPEVYARWDRINHIVHTYEEKNTGGQQPSVYYDIHHENLWAPDTLTPWHVSRNYSAVLEQTEQAIASLKIQ